MNAPTLDMHISEEAAKYAVMQTIKEAAEVSQAKTVLLETKVECAAELAAAEKRLAGALNGPQPLRAQTEIKNLKRQHEIRVIMAEAECDRLENIRLAAYQESAKRSEEFLRAQRQDAAKRAKAAFTTAYKQRAQKAARKTA